MFLRLERGRGLRLGSVGLIGRGIGCEKFDIKKHRERGDVFLFCFILESIGSFVLLLLRQGVVLLIFCLLLRTLVLLGRLL